MLQTVLSFKKSDIVSLGCNLVENQNYPLKAFIIPHLILSKLHQAEVKTWEILKMHLQNMSTPLMNICLGHFKARVYLGSCCPFKFFIH